LAIIRLQRKDTKTPKGKYYSYFVTIPKDYVEILGWEKGDRIAIELKQVEGRRGLFLYKIRKEE